MAGRRLRGAAPPPRSASDPHISAGSSAEGFFLAADRTESYKRRQEAAAVYGHAGVRNGTRHPDIPPPEVLRMARSANLDFFAVEADQRAVLDFLFSSTDVRVFSPTPSTTPSCGSSARPTTWPR